MPGPAFGACPLAVGEGQVGVVVPAYGACPARGEEPAHAYQVHALPFALVLQLPPPLAPRRRLDMASQVVVRHHPLDAEVLDDYRRAGVGQGARHLVRVVRPAVPDLPVQAGGLPLQALVVFRALLRPGQGLLKLRCLPLQTLEALGVAVHRPVGQYGQVLYPEVDPDCALLRYLGFRYRGGAVLDQDAGPHVSAPVAPDGGAHYPRTLGELAVLVELHTAHLLEEDGPRGEVHGYPVYVMGGLVAALALENRESRHGAGIALLPLLQGREEVAEGAVEVAEGLLQDYPRALAEPGELIASADLRQLLRHREERDELPRPLVFLLLPPEKMVVDPAHVAARLAQMTVLHQRGLEFVFVCFQHGGFFFI